MQTIYYSTPNFIHHQSNVVDFTEYRRRLALAEEGSLAPQPRTEEYSFAPGQEQWEQPVLHVIAHKPRHSRRRAAWTLDLAASLGVVVMTLTFTLQVLLG